MDYISGAELLEGCNTHEEKLERACAALIDELNELHIRFIGQDLRLGIDDPHIFCSCADAYRMGAEALKGTSYEVGRK